MARLLFSHCHVQLFANPWTAGFPVLHYLPELLKLISIELVMLSNHPIICHPLHLLSSMFPNISVFGHQLFTSGGQSIGALRLLEELISSYLWVWESITTYQSVRAWTVPLFLEATSSSGHGEFLNVTAYLIKSARNLLSKPVSKKSLSNIVWSQREHTFSVPYFCG